MTERSSTVSVRLVGLAGVLVFCLGWMGVSRAANAHAWQPRVVAYVTSWSMPSSIPAEHLTHINFAFAKIDRSGRAAFEDPHAIGALDKLVSHKNRHPDLKILISVGGWQAEGFSDAALTETSRKVFARSLVKLIRDHSIDGIDLDWEYPGQGAGGIKYRPEDKRNFTLLLETVRRHLDEEAHRVARHRYLLTIASADREYFDHTEMNQLHVHLDWINIMTYDFYNSLTRTTGHHAGLYRAELAPATGRNADSAVRQHLNAGIPAAKLVLGVAFYGRSFAGVTAQHRGLLQPYERYEADYSYRDLIDRFIGRQGFVRYWDDRAQAPYLWNETSRTFITYDDPQSIEVKARYAKAQGLGGVMFWELSQDRNGELLSAVVRGSR